MAAFTKADYALVPVFFETSLLEGIPWALHRISFFLAHCAILDNCLPFLKGSSRAVLSRSLGPLTTHRVQVAKLYSTVLALITQGVVNYSLFFLA